MFPNELIIDDIEAKYGEPRNAYQHKEVPIDVLISKYPDKKKEISESTNFRSSGALHGRQQDAISVVEGWHLPCKDDKGNTIPGRHIIVTSKCTLVDEAWELDRFPFAIFRWNKRTLGYFGQGIAEIVEGIQFEVNSVLLKLQKLLKLATSKVFVQKGTKVNKSALNNEDWGVVEYAGNRPPEWKTIQAFSPDYAAYLESLYNRAFELVGISQLSAQSKKPEGLNSGKAIREYMDIQTKRFEEVGQAWNQFHLDIADLFIMMAKLLDEKLEGGYSVLADVGEKLVELKWKDVNLDKDSYVMKSWPVPVLTGSPAFQLQTILDVGQINPNLQSALLPHLEHPDVKAFLDRENADMVIVDKISAAILAGEEYPPPEPLMNLGLVINQMRKVYMQAVINQ